MGADVGEGRDEMTKNRRYTQGEILDIFGAVAAGWDKDRVMGCFNLTDSQLETIIYRRVARYVVLPHGLELEALRMYQFSRRLSRKSKLTNDDVLAICEARAADVSLSTLAKRYGVSPSTISRIGNGQRRAVRKPPK